MRPRLKPALRRVWRDNSTLQIGIDPQRAVVLAGLVPEAARLVETLDGTRDSDGVLAVARDLGLDTATALRLLDLLETGGALDDAATDTRPLFALRADERERLGPDIASVSLVRSISDAGMTVLARRRSSTVRVHGGSRVGASVSALLAAAGVGQVSVVDPELARLADAAPAGLTPDDAGIPRDTVAGLAVRRAAPTTRTDPPARPDLVILAPATGTPPMTLVDEVLREGLTHVFAGVRETTGTIGPLVLPGRSSCLRCHNLHRGDRDPAWPRVAAQLATPAGTAVACDVALATAVAAHCTLQALAYLDGEPRPAAVDGTLEITLPDGRLRRRSWTPHPECGCTWAQGT